MTSEEFLASAILKELRRVYLCTTTELCGLLPQFPPGDIIASVERLIQEEAIAFRSSEPSHLILWLPPTRAARRVSHGPLRTAVPNFDSVGLSHKPITDHGSIIDATASLTPYEENMVATDRLSGGGKSASEFFGHVGNG